MNLQPKHLKEWQDSAVSPEIIKRNVWSIDDSREADELLNRNTERKWKHSEGLVPGWAVAGVDPKEGERVYSGAQFKPDTPPPDPKTGKKRKYFSPSQDPLSPLFLEVEDVDYWRKLLTDFTSQIIITEGAKKAGAALSNGQACISLPGVSTGGKHGRLKPQLELYCRYGRSIYLAFDRDIIEKRQVQQALHNLGRMLTARGCMVYVLSWPNSYKGLDDWLASIDDDERAKKLRDRIATAQTLEEWKAANDEGKGDTVSLDDACRLAKRYRKIEAKLLGRLRWNQLKGMVELDGKPVELDALRMYLALKHNIDIPGEDCSQIVIHMAKEQSYSPVAEYLKNIAQAYQEDSDLLDSLALKYLGSDSELHRVYIRKTLISAVARALQPGCKVDTVCILSGLQGVGKSTFWKILAGEENFDDSVGSVSDKDERLKLHKSWFVEWAELESVFRRKDVSAVKAFITTQVDQLRPPYGRSVMEFSRPSILVGTTNFDNFLADSTGNRRFWVIPIVTEAIPLEELAKERDRIWAAAVHAYLGGEHWGLPPEMRAAAAEDAERFAQTDPWEDPVLNFIENKQFTTVGDILLLALKMDIGQHDKRSEMRVTNLLKTAGWGSDRKVVHGKRRRVWSPPNITDIGCPGRAEDSKGQTERAGQPPGQPPAQPPRTTPCFVRSAEQLAIPAEGVDNLDGQPDHFPKSTIIQDPSKSTSNHPLIDINALVSIAVGNLKGTFARVVSINSDKHTVELRSEGWRSTKWFSLDDLNLPRAAHASVYDT
ncbi:MAG: VapE domain-containing protein [Cyanobacteria bacterium J06560_5]